MQEQEAYVSMSRLAEILSTTEAQVRRMIRRGIIPAVSLSPPSSRISSTAYRCGKP